MRTRHPHAYSRLNSSLKQFVKSAMVSRDVCWRVLLAMLVTQTTVCHAATFQGLGDLPGGNFESDAYGVSADGSVVSGTGYAASGLQAYRWTSGTGMVGLGNLPDSLNNNFGFGVSNDGSVVVGYGFAPGLGAEAYRWTSGTGMVGLGDLAGGVFNSYAWAASNDGSVVVGYGSSTSGSEAFRWTNGTGMVELGDLPGGMFQSLALDVSGDGSVVVGSASSASGSEAFRWTSGGGMVGLGDLPGGGFQSTALSVSDDGFTAVGWSISAAGTEAFRWTNGGGMVGLGDLPGGSFGSLASGASADGSVVVGRGVSALGSEAFFWTNGGGMQNLRDVLIAGGATGLTGWTLNEARSVSADGRTIVGSGTNPLGQTEAWIATVPEPSTLALSVGSALALLLAVHLKTTCRQAIARRIHTLRLTACGLFIGVGLWSAGAPSASAGVASFVNYQEAHENVMFDDTSGIPTSTIVDHDYIADPPQSFDFGGGTALLGAHPSVSLKSSLAAGGIEYTQRSTTSWLFELGDSEDKIAWGAVGSVTVSGYVAPGDQAFINLGFSVAGPSGFPYITDLIYAPTYQLIEEIDGGGDFTRTLSSYFIFAAHGPSSSGSVAWFSSAGVNLRRQVGTAFPLSDQDRTSYVNFEIANAFSIPEPASLTLMGAGIGVLALCAARRARTRRRVFPN